MFASIKLIRVSYPTERPRMTVLIGVRLCLLATSAPAQVPIVNQTRSQALKTNLEPIAHESTASVTANLIIHTLSVNYMDRHDRIT